MIISRFPMGGGKSKYAEGSVTATGSRSYSLSVDDLGFTPAVFYVSVYSYSDSYSQTTQATVQNNDGTAATLVSYRDVSYVGVPTFTITENGFTVSGVAPPHLVETKSGVNMTYKAWG